MAHRAHYRIDSLVYRRGLLATVDEGLTSSWDHLRPSYLLDNTGRFRVGGPIRLWAYALASTAGHIAL